MRFDYWTIQARPDPGRLLTYGVGVVVMDARRHDVRVEIIDRADALPTVGDRDAVLAAAKSVAGDIGDLTGNPDRLELPGTDTPSSFLSRISGQWASFLTVDRPRSVSARTIDEATQLMFDLYIGDTHVERRRNRITVLRNEVQEAYESRPALREALRRKPGISAGAVSGVMDLAVIGEEHRILELSSSFTFRQRDPRQAQARAENWLYRISRLRDRGGILDTEEPGGVQITVDRDVPVVATYDPAETAVQQEVLDNVCRQWEDLGVTAVPVTGISGHAEQLVERLHAA